MQTEIDQQDHYAEKMSQGPRSFTIDDAQSDLTVPTPASDSFLSRCHWRGSHLFMAILADDLYRQASVSDTAEELTIRLEEAIRSFPWSQCLKKLASVKDVNLRGADYHDSLVWETKAKIGVLMNDEDAEIRDKAIRTLQSPGSAKSPVAALGQRVVRAPSSASTVTNEGYQSVGEQDKQLPMCSMRLNEWCQLRNKHHSYSSRQITVDPPRFEATVHVDGHYSYGMARNKKTAQHCAAREACRHLGIPV